MNNINKKISSDYFLMLSAALFLIATGVIVVWTYPKKEPVAANQSKMEIIGSIVLTVDFGNGRKRAFEGNIVKSETFFDALNQASKAGNFSYKLDEKNNLAAVESFVKNGEKSWSWYLNGKKISTANEIFLKNNDKILIKYE